MFWGPEGYVSQRYKGNDILVEIKNLEVLIDESNLVDKGYNATIFNRINVDHNTLINENKCDQQRHLALNSKDYKMSNENPVEEDDILPSKVKPYLVEDLCLDDPLWTKKLERKLE